MRALSDLMRNFVQLGYVTDDVDVAAEFLEKKFGTVECVKHYQSNMGGGNPADPESSYYVIVGDQLAQDWTIDVVLVNAGGTNIEIIRPVSGAVDLYRGAVRPGVPATLHHLGFKVDDFDEATRVVTEAGGTWAQYGLSGDMRFGYLDTVAALGHYIEVMELGPNGATMFAQLEAASNERVPA
ncbi:MAG: VOC family protein [Nocardioides sp.]|uniref:VOC family protein n=1 Tax=Nocardioides sp. TaxID=35761 RepID=UPI0039E6772E